MLVFKNCKGNIDGRSIDCFVEPISDDNTSRSDDGSFMSKTYKILFDMGSMPTTPPQYIELQHERNGYLGMFYVQTIKYYDLTKSIEMIAEIRPHSISKINASIEFDVFGNPTPQQESRSEPIPCLYKQNTTANKISILEDGRKYVYSFEVSLSRDCEEFKVGDLVVLFDNNGKEVSRKEVRGFTRQRLNSTLWM